MKCNQLKAILAERFDRNEWTVPSSAEQTHLARCPDCQNYYISLKKLDEGIGELTNHPVSDPKIEEGLRKIKLTEHIFSKDRFFFKKWQLAAAVIFMLFAGLVSQLFFDFPPSKRSQSVSGLYLHSAQVEKRSARTVIFQSAEENKPFIIWLY